MWGDSKMIRIDPSKWTADFRISRALAEAYTASGLEDVVFFCVGDPDDVVGRLGPIVGDETIKYYPNVIGTSEDPITRQTIDEKADELFDRFPDCYVIGVEAGYGLPAHLGSIEITDRGLASIGHSSDVNDLTINVVLRVRERGPRKRAGAQTNGAIKGKGMRNGRPRSSGLKEALLEVGSDPIGADDGDANEPTPYGRKEKFTPLLPEQIDRYKVQQLADKVIDGHLRLLSRIKKQPL